MVLGMRNAIYGPTAGINMELFSPHSTRRASTSYAKCCLPLDTILKVRGWRCMKTFAQYYDKLTETRDSNFAYNIERTQ